MTEVKSALFTFQDRESTIDFDGHLSLVFFTQGCNFNCRYCHNPELLTFRDSNMTYDELGGVLERARGNWVDAVCITGGEPCMQKELAATASFIKKKGMALKLDTQGSFPERLEEVLPYCDYVAMDYKMPMERYDYLARVKVDAGSVWKSLDLLKNGTVDYEIRTTIIPGIHEEEDIRKICAELSGVKRYVLQSFIPRDNLPDEELRLREKTPPAMLEAFAEICRDFFEEVVVR